MSESAVYEVTSGSLRWEGLAASHDDAARRAFTAAPPGTRVGFAVRVKLKGVRGSSRWAASAHLSALLNGGGGD